MSFSIAHVHTVYCPHLVVGLSAAYYHNALPTTARRQWMTREPWDLPQALFLTANRAKHTRMGLANIGILYNLLFNSLLASSDSEQWPGCVYIMQGCLDIPDIMWPLCNWLMTMTTISIINTIMQHVSLLSRGRLLISRLRGEVERRMRRHALTGVSIRSCEWLDDGQISKVRRWKITALAS